MEWIFAILALFGTLALLDDVHTKWHQRQMAKDRNWKETIYS